MSTSLSRRSLVAMLASCPLCAEAASAAAPGTCDPGSQQSPIDLRAAKDESVPKAIEIHYQPAGLTLKRVGESFKLYPTPGSFIKIGNDKYELYEFHFHHPAEHLLSDTPHPMECHFVNKMGQHAAVVGVFIAEGNANQTMEPIWKALPPADNAHGTTLPGRIDLSHLLPRNMNGPLFRYDGSLTSAPFPAPQGLIWSVYQETVEASADQIATYRCMYPPNARAVQPLNGRPLKRLIVAAK